MNAEQYCQKVDEVLTQWLDVRMKDYTEKQYGKAIIRELRDANPSRSLHWGV